MYTLHSFMDTHLGAMCVKVHITSYNVSGMSRCLFMTGTGSELQEILLTVFALSHFPCLSRQHKYIRKQ